jgi:hypothetical protein
MENEKPPIPFRMTLLIVGYFQRNINEAEQTEPDDWMCASMDNQRAFGDCVEMSLRPHIKNEVDIKNDELRREQEALLMEKKPVPDLRRRGFAVWFN